MIERQKGRAAKLRRKNPLSVPLNLEIVKLAAMTGSENSSGTVKGGEIRAAILDLLPQHPHRCNLYEDGPQHGEKKELAL